MTIQRRILAGHLAFTCLLLVTAIVALNAFTGASRERIDAMKLDPGLKEAQLLRLQLDALQRWVQIREALPADDLQDPAFRKQEAARYNEDITGARGSFRALRLKLDRFREGLSLPDPPACPALEAMLAVEWVSGGNGAKQAPARGPGTGGTYRHRCRGDGGAAGDGRSGRRRRFGSWRGERSRSRDRDPPHPCFRGCARPGARSPGSGPGLLAERRPDQGGSGGGLGDL